MTLDLMELVVTRAEVSEGKSPTWQPWEDAYLKANLGYKTEEEIAAYLGRTQFAVHLRWKRYIHLTAPSKEPSVLSAFQSAKLLGVHYHKIVRLCDAGVIQYRWMRGKSNKCKRFTRLIDRMYFCSWIINTENWVYFDWKKITDTELRRLCELKLLESDK